MTHVVKLDTNSDRRFKFINDSEMLVSGPTKGRPPDAYVSVA